MEVNRFVGKLNKVDGNVYVIEEEAHLADGVYEAALEHDNINPSTLAVYTGPRLTGERVESYTLSTPSLTPWKKVIRVYADVPEVFISYETDGDMVEAEDINRAQAAITGTQEALNAEAARAAEAESGLARGLQAEERRAVGEEARLDGRVDDERDRAMAAEQSLSGAVSAEVSRAEGAEKLLADTLAGERQRAESAERDLAGRIAAETARAEAVEGNLAEGISAETTRAEAAEKQNADNIKAETARAQGRESEIATSLANEAARAKEAEQALASGLAEEAGRAKDAEKAITASLVGEVARAKEAEKENREAIAAEARRAQAKETELQGSIQSEKARAEAAEASIRGTIDTNKPVWDDKYTRNEVDNKFSALETAIDWKESVATFADIVTAYPNPEDGWTVNVKDTDYTYRWNGTEWVTISANAIPKATQGVDGLLAKEDKANYDDAYAHISDTVKHVTAAERTKWNAVTDKVDKVSGKQLSTNDYTTAEKDNLSRLKKSFTDPIFITDFNSFVPTMESKGMVRIVACNQSTPGSPSTNGCLGLLIQTGSAYFTLRLYAVAKFSAWERYYADETWSDWVKTANSTDLSNLTDSVNNLLNHKVDKVSGKQLSTNDYTAAEKTKLSGIAAGAEVNVQADWDITDPASDAFIRNKPVSMPASDVPVWAKAASKPAYAWTEVTGKPETFPPAAHTHSKSQITDMPTKVSQLANDAGYITQEDVDTSQDHTHANKAALDKITQALLDNWSSAYSHISDAVKHVTAAERTNWNDANAKKHSHENKTVLDKVTQAMMDTWNKALTELPVHTHTKTQITDFPASLPANGGTADYANHLNANSLAANTDLNTVTVPGYYYCPANATAATLKNCPTTDAFFLETGKHAGVYQRLVEYITSNPRTFERNCYSGTWGAWKNITVLTPVPAGAKFTDTVYAHPNSGAAAGTYRSITVNAQGHVTAGTNPTTLAGYGITDAAAKSHSHDGDYLKKGTLTWADLKGGG